MFRNMKYIYAVYKMGSFSAAAESLFVTQPCLSAMVKKTEEQLGVPIFDRKSKPICLTEYGIRYISYLEKIQALESELEQYLNDVRGLRTGNLFIGANNVLASYILPGLIHKFKAHYPGVQVQMTEGNISYLENSLTRGVIDLVLDNCPMNPDLFEQHTLGSEHLLLAVHRSFRRDDRFASSRFTYKDILANRHINSEISAVSIQAFADMPFIALRAGNDTRYRMDQLFCNAQVQPHIQLEVDQLATAYNIACSKLGATFVSDTLIYKAPPNPDMDFYKLDDAAAIRPIYLYSRRSRYVSLAMQKFMDVAALFFSKEPSKR